MEILLIDDNPGDVRLMRESFKEAEMQINLHVVRDGLGAMAFLRKEDMYADRPRPDLILLDLNLPKKDGREVLIEIKQDPDLKRIPVVILTGSVSEEDVIGSYDCHANCYIIKPFELNQFIEVIKSIEKFWFSIVKLPSE